MTHRRRPPWFTVAHTDYLHWFQGMTRTRFKPTSLEHHIEDAPSGEEEDYNMETRIGTQPEHGPLHDYTI